MHLNNSRSIGRSRYELGISSKELCHSIRPEAFQIGGGDYALIQLQG